MHPILLPGTHLLRRDSRTLQVGLDPAARVLLPDTPANRRVVMDPPPSATRAALGRHLLPDDTALRAAMPTDQGDPDDVWVRHSLAATARRGVPVTTEGVRVRVQPYGGRLSQLIAAELRSVLHRAALPAPRRLAPGPPPRGRAPRELHVVVGVGEPSRARLDLHVEHGAPHLLLRFVEGRALVGPFVVPGTTACLRCLDLHRTESDPAWPLLVEQYSRLTRQDRPDGVPEPVDAALAYVAMGWVAREVSAYLGGDGPATHSRVLTVSADLAEVAVQEYPPRTDCGCQAR